MRFISTDVGVVRYFPGGAIVKSVDEMATAIGTVMRDDELYHQKSAEGSSYARQRMQIADKVDALEAIWKEWVIKFINTYEFRENNLWICYFVSTCDRRAGVFSSDGGAYTTFLIE